MLGNNTPIYSKTVVCRYDKRGNRILTGTNKGYLNVIDPNTRRVSKFIYFSFIYFIYRFFMSFFFFFVRIIFRY
jgi:hypothetical protein